MGKALDNNGNVKWSIPTTGQVSNVAWGKDGTLYFDISYEEFCLGSEVGSKATLFAVNNEGKVLWKHQTKADKITSPPAFGKDGVIYLTAVKAVPSPYYRRTEIVYAVEPPNEYRVTFVV